MFYLTLVDVSVCVLIAVAGVEGENLVLNKITRSESGAYLCIASNGVPPSVSKRILLDVECKLPLYGDGHELLSLMSHLNVRLRIAHIIKLTHSHAVHI